MVSLDMASEVTQDIPRVYDFSNYREFLKSYFQAAKARDRKFSFRYFARITGFSSSNFLMLVMNGKRNISMDSAEKIAGALKLNKEETIFFRNLVMLNQSRTAEGRQIFAEELLRSRAFKKLHPLKEAQFNYFSHWYYVMVRELVGLPEFKEDPQWIADNTVFKISPAEAKRALEELHRLGLIERNSSGRLIQSQRRLTTGDEVTSSSVAQFHREMMKRASESIDVVSRDHRDISSVTLLTSRESAGKVKEMIQKFRKDVMRVLAEADRANAVYQLNFQLFPLIELKGTGDEGAE